MARLARSFLMLLAVVFMNAGAAVADSRGSTLEYTVKAAYIYKFAAYVQWPEETFTSPSSPLNICIAGSDPVADQLKVDPSPQKIGERSIVIRETPSLSNVSDCQILYIGSSGNSAADWAQLPVEAPMLTVTDSSEGSDLTGMINFLIEDNNVRFEIDIDAASRSKLVVSSKLLTLAVHPRPRSGGRH